MSADQPGIAAAPSAAAAPPATVRDAPLAGGNGDNGAGRARRGRFVRSDEAVSDGESGNGVSVPDGPKRLTRRERKQLGRLRARKVRRVIRHIDPWSVLKVSLLFYLCLFVVLMVAGVVLWNLAAAAGTISDIEGFFKSAGAFESFTFDGFTIFRASVLIGLILVIAGTAVNVLLAVVFNLISDVVGGLRVSVIEEETARPVAAEVPVRRQ